jgi:hypothetical protein
VLFNYMKFDLDGAIAAASMVSIVLALAVVLGARTAHRPARLRETLNRSGEDTHDQMANFTTHVLEGVRRRRSRCSYDRRAARRTRQTATC